MNNKRLEVLINGNKKDGKYVIYYMQQSQRVNYNHALNYAIDLANRANLPLVVFFSLFDEYKDANLRHFKFMLEGLKEVENKLNEMGISFIIKKVNPLKLIKPYLNDASAVVLDYGYLKEQVKIRKDIIDLIGVFKIKPSLYLIESDVVVPVRYALDRLAYGAYILRKPLMSKIDSFDDFKYLKEINNKTIIKDSDSLNLSNIDEILKMLDIDRTVKPYDEFKGGYTQAIKHLNNFLNNGVNNYDQRNDPSNNIQSYLSMYLHFGQISSLEIYNIFRSFYLANKISKENYDSFIEQLIVRRELSFNFVYYNNNYDQFEFITEPWAYQTMEEHQDDRRLYLYTIDEIENAKTHDKYFNAAMLEMKKTGFMAGYMRMYWGKKIMEWSSNMKEAYNRLIYLNNKYFIDGRDANSYLNIAWCFGKMDRAFKERAVFGKLRYMNDKGLERKFKIDLYVDKVNNL